MLVTAKRSRSTQMYKGKADTMAANNARVSEIVAIAAAQLATTIDPNKRVRLTETEKIQLICMQYLSACVEASVVPTLTGFAAATGHTRAAFYKFMQESPDHATSRFIRSCCDTFAEIVMQNALSGSVQAIPAIFNLKSRFGWRDDGEVLKEPDEKVGLDAEAIMEKYQDLPE